MRILCLNTWGGKLFHPLITFIKNHAEIIDIFCFQEIYKNKIPVDLAHPNLKDARQSIFYDMEETLPQFQGFYSSFQDNNEGMAIFFRKSLPIQNSGERFVLRHKNAMADWSDHTTLGKTIQWIEFFAHDKKITVINFHGVCGDQKKDTPDRIVQSTNIKKFLDTVDGAKILCGDFNIDHNTESLKILENGMTNMIKQHNIQGTRTKLYRHYDTETLFADYILTSPGVRVIDFRVLQNEVSDHFPLYFEFE